MRRTFCNIFSVVFTLIKFSILKLFHLSGFHFNCIERFSPNVVVEFNRKSIVFFGKKVRVHSGCKIKVRSGAHLYIGSNVRINYNCIIISRENIKIDDNTEIGPNVMIFDHDHDYKAGLKKELFITKRIIIGKNCWIGAGTTILKGTTIGDNCVIAAGSVVNGNLPDNTVLIQKKETNYNNYGSC